MEAKQKGIKSRYGKYSRTIDAFLKTGANVGKVEKTKTSVTAMYMGLDRAIKRDYSGKALLSIIDGEIYIERIF